MRTALSNTPFGPSRPYSYHYLLAGYAPPAHLVETPVQAANRPWFLLPAAAQEKTAVYSAGLFIYTVFEGLSNVRHNIAN